MHRILCSYNLQTSSTCCHTSTPANNNIPTFQVNNLGSTASVSTLSWGNAAELATLQQRLPGLRPCSLLLASDVIYQLAQLDDLMSTMRGLMDAETLLLLSIEDRAPAESWLWRQKLKGHGLAIVREVGLEEMAEDWRDPAIHVLEIRLSSSL